MVIDSKPPDFKLRFGEINIDAIYVHIPFCLKKCYYCDFVSYPLEDLPIKEYCQALVSEGKMYHKLITKEQKKIRSIYIGGGTPTCLPAEYLVDMLNELGIMFPLDQGGEITVECNPQTVDQAYLERLQRAGVNRLSIGAQSFDPGLLKDMGRIHSVQDIFKTIDHARKAGFTNISLDLIYGLPHQTIDQWSDTLKEAVSLPVMHLSVYGLKLSEQSSWGKRYLEGSLTLPDDEISAEMQELAMDYLEGQGFVHYEIANFSRPGFFSVHNRVYWNNENYLGLGIAAASHFANYRKTNTGSLTDYISDLNRGRFPEAEWETLNRETEMAETIFLGLRLLDGLSFEAFEKRFGIDFCHRYEKQLGKLKGLGLVEHDQERIRLTKKGIFLANEVFVEFLP